MRGPPAARVNGPDVVYYTGMAHHIYKEDEQEEKERLQTPGAGEDCRGHNFAPSHQVKRRHRRLPRDGRPSLKDFARALAAYSGTDPDHEFTARAARRWLDGKRGK